MAARLPDRYRLVDQLNAEWDRLVDVHGGTVAGWARMHPALRGCPDLPSVLAAIRRDPDRVLSALLTEATAGNILAARVVLQTMLPKVVRLSATHPGIEVDEFVSALWCRILTYPLDRRPRSIAANLALDTLKDGRRAHRAEHLEHAYPGFSGGGLEQLLQVRHDREHLDHQADLAHLRAAEVLEAATTIGILDRSTHEVLRTVYVDGASSRTAGDRHALSADLVRYRCSRAVRRMAGRAREIADAAA